jgi:hypothetical protein
MLCLDLSTVGVGPLGAAMVVTPAPAVQPPHANLANADISSIALATSFSA